MTGTATLSVPTIVHTGKDGAFVDDAARSVVDEAFAHDLASARKLVLYFHGGLNDASTGMKVAQKLDPLFRAAGAEPIFFVWESGLLDILSHNIAEIAGEDVFNILLKHVLKFASAKLTESDGARAPGDTLVLPNDLVVYQELAKREINQEPFAEFGENAPVSEITESEEYDFRQSLSESPDFIETVDAIVASVLPEETVSRSRGVDVRSRKSMRTLMSPEIVEEIRGDAEVAASSGARGIFSTGTMLLHAGKVLTRVIRRFRTGRAHGLYPTVVEEILREFYLANVGLKIWGAMKRETYDTFQPATPLRGGQYVVAKLAELGKHSPPPEISLIGHSTGAVFINHLLAYVQTQKKAGQIPGDFAFKQIILLAPASTFRDFAPYVQAPYFSQPGGLYERIRVFAMSDKAECQDALVPFVYPRSLLYLVSGILEGGTDGKSAADVPLVGMQRYYTGKDVYSDEDVGVVRDFMSGPGDRSVWSPSSAGGGLSSGAVRHGDFDDDATTRESIASLI
jgi:hypothetical protein